jgi:hypothetical protein
MAKVKMETWTRDGGWVTTELDDDDICPTCCGIGWISDMRCEDCYGTGLAEDNLIDFPPAETVEVVDESAAETEDDADSMFAKFEDKSKYRRPQYDLGQGNGYEHWRY